jgi:hypothetical protein
LKNKDKIPDVYRDQIDKFLDHQSTLNHFNTLNNAELDEIWEEISSEMDIDDVWNGISSDLGTLMPVHYGSGIIIRSIAALIIILVGMIPVKKETIYPLNSQTGVLFKNERFVHSEKKIVKNKIGNTTKGEQKKYISPAIIRAPDKNKDYIKVKTKEMVRPGPTVGKPLQESRLAVPGILTISDAAGTDPDVSHGKNPIEESYIPPALLPAGLKEIKVSPGPGFSNLRWNDNSSTIGFSSPLNDYRRISIGLIALFKNTWLLNHETYEGLNSASLSTTKIVFYPDVGLSLNYTLNKTWLLQCDGFFYSNTGQKYYEYIAGHYSRKIITLRYSTFALAVKHKFFAGMHRTSINLMGGGYFSVLNYADQKINNDLQKIGSQYNRFDYGLKLESEVEMYLFNNVSIAPGLGISYGIPNIYKGTGNIPGYLRITHNGSAEFHFSLYYHFD